MRTIHNWTEKEHDILRKHYNKDMTAEDIYYKYLPYLSVPVIQARASILGLTKSPRWTDEEVAILKKYAGTISAEEIHNKYLPNRSVSAVRGKANNMKLTPYKRVYTKKAK